MKALRCFAGLLCLLFLFLLAGCSTPKNTAEDNAAESSNTSISIYASFYPVYALADLIVQGVPELELNCLVQPQDGCLRSYQLSDWDLAMLTSSADAILCAGRGLEGFESALYALGENGPAVVSLLYDADLSAEDATEEAEGNHWNGENPHIYLKIDGAFEMVESIAANLAVLDPKYSESYANNLETTNNRLKSLQKEMHEIAGMLEGKPVILMNEALVYVAEEYGLQPAFCAERESCEVYDEPGMKKLLEDMKNCGANVVLIEKQAPEHFCKALEDAGFAVARMDVLSTRSVKEGAEGYFEAQRANAQVLQTAFSETRES